MSIVCRVFLLLMVVFFCEFMEIGSLSMECIQSILDDLVKQGMGLFPLLESFV